MQHISCCCSRNNLICICTAENKKKGNNVMSNCEFTLASLRQSCLAIIHSISCLDLKKSLMLINCFEVRQKHTLKRVIYCMKLYYQSRNDFKNCMLTSKFLIILSSAESPSPNKFECVGLDEWDL